MAHWLPEEPSAEEDPEELELEEAGDDWAAAGVDWVAAGVDCTGAGEEAE